MLSGPVVRARGTSAVAPEENRALAYILDRWKRIEAIEGPWDQFASENGTENAFSNRVIGSELWDLVAGIEARAYLNAAFYWCLIERTIFEADYRCDSLNKPRICRMTVEPVGLGALRVSHRTVWEGTPRLEVCADVVRLAEPRCSICCRYQIGAHWIDAFSEPDYDFVPTSHVVCPDCRNDLRKVLRARSRVPQPPLGYYR